MYIKLKLSQTELIIRFGEDFNVTTLKTLLANFLEINPETIHIYHLGKPLNGSQKFYCNLTLNVYIDKCKRTQEDITRSIKSLKKPIESLDLSLAGKLSVSILHY